MKFVNVCRVLKVLNPEKVLHVVNEMWFFFPNLLFLIKCVKFVNVWRILKLLTPEKVLQVGSECGFIYVCFILL